MSEAVEVVGGDLRVGEKRAPLSAIVGLEERYGRWSGRARLVLRGTSIQVPLREGYGEIRARLRQILGDRPFSSDWSDGRFPGSPAGLPPDLVFGISVAFSGAIALVVGLNLGAVAGLAVVLASVWPLGRLRDAWVVRDEGIRGGPPWGSLVPWYDVESVCIRVGTRRAWIWTRGRGATQVASLPRSLVPAFRARVRRLGGIELTEDSVGLDDRYGRWRAPAVGIPWGIGLGTLAIAWFTPTPWTTMVAGAAAMIATGLLGAMVTLRAQGWGTGGVLAGTLLYGFLLLGSGFLLGGWLGGS